MPALRESSSLEDRVTAIKRVIGLTGGPDLAREFVAAMAKELADLSADELQRASDLLVRDEELVRSIRFGGKLALADFYRVLRGNEPPAQYLDIDEAIAKYPWADRRMLESGELRIKRGKR